MFMPTKKFFFIIPHQAGDAEDPQYPGDRLGNPFQQIRNRPNIPSIPNLSAIRCYNSLPHFGVKIAPTIALSEVTPFLNEGVSNKPNWIQIWNKVQKLYFYPRLF